MAMTFHRRRLREQDAEALTRSVKRLLIVVVVALLALATRRRWRRRGAR